MGAALRVLEQGGASATLSLISLLLFVTVFVGVIVWTLRKSHDEPFEQARHLPFDDEDHHHTGGNRR